MTQRRRGINEVAPITWCIFDMMTTMCSYMRTPRCVLLLLLEFEQRALMEIRLLVLLQRGKWAHATLTCKSMSTGMQRMMLLKLLRLLLKLMLLLWLPLLLVLL